jgi:hypothetical protein
MISKKAFHKAKLTGDQQDALTGWIEHGFFDKSPGEKYLNLIVCVHLWLKNFQKPSIRILYSARDNG